MNRTIFLVLAALGLTACIHVENRLYNPENPSADSRAKNGNGHRSVVEVSTTTDHPNPECDPYRTPCLAFLEFDEQGELWDPMQLQAALKLIRAAKAHPHPIIVTFTHGWKNNALDDRPKNVNGNIYGFEGILNYLKDPTQNGGKFGDSPVVGIFIGWRGTLISSRWPVQQQLSYFNREGTAIRIPGASLTSALTEMMEAAHSPMPTLTDAPPMLVMVGHSFGGLIMERALTQAMADYILRGGPRSDGPWADLVVFVNSAAAASEGKQLLDLLKSRQIHYSVNDDATKIESQAGGLGRRPERPLFLSISSLGDAATRFGLVIGHGPSAINRQLNGSWRQYTNPEPPNVPSEESFYLSTTAHMDALQSHLIVEAPPKPGQCGPTFGQPVTITLAGVAGKNSSPTKQYVICEKPNRWNTTPYWAMEMPATIVPDHSGIFNTNFLNLLEEFLPSNNEMTNPEHRPQLSAAPTASQ